MTAGADFLLLNSAPEDCFFPEDFTEEHRQIARTAADFMTQEVIPAHDAIESKNFAVTRQLMRRAGELGLTSIDIPEEYGGLAMDKVASAIVAEETGSQGSFCVIFAADVGIGTLPIVWYGTPEQKERYLPGLASGGLIGAYALSEASSGSDALNARTRAVLSEDRAAYMLNGEKMWITNAGMADLFTVFAKCSVPDTGEEKLTAFLVERSTPGLSLGPEEHKLGIHGSSTCPLILKDCRIPATNLLGEVGKGHRIAFNILNIGRYKLGATAIGGAKTALNEAIQYAKDRRAFGKSIAEFGLIQQKIATSAADVFACEALCYRTIGMIDRALAEVAGDDTAEIQRRIEEYAVECSIVKVWASEMLDRLVDEAVQIFAGYGYVEDYPAARHYRDSRINRIFEGTNEINRLIISGWVLKSATSGKLPLMPAIRQVMEDVMAGPSSADTGDGPLDAELDQLASAKKIFLFAAGCATQHFAAKLADQQEVMAALADIIAEIFVLESTLLRALKVSSKAEDGIAVASARLYAIKAASLVELAARKVIAASAEGDALGTQMTILRRLAKHNPADSIALGRTVAAHMVRAGRYVL